MVRAVREHDVTVIEVQAGGESLDLEAAQDLRRELLTVAEACEPPRVVIDLETTPYLGSSLIELLVQTWKRLGERGGSMALCGVQPLCAEVLRISRLQSLWPVYAERAQAVAALGSEALPQPAVQPAVGTATQAEGRR